MSLDVSKPVIVDSTPEWDLPEILDIRIRRIPFKPHRLQNFKSALSEHKEAVEFLVRTSGPIPVRALGPAIFVGDVQIVESQQVGDNLYRFLAFDIKRLKPGEPIRWGWINAPKGQQQVTKFRY
jgi:hypothetical protein